MGARTPLKVVGPMLLWATAISTMSVPLAHAGDLTISDSRTESVDTLTGDGEGPGTIIIDSTGSIQTPIGPPGTVIILSDHSVSNSGTITALGSSTSGILGFLTNVDPDTNEQTPLNLTSSIVNLGSIGVGDPVGDLDDSFSAFNAGIRVSGLGTFIGDISNGTIADLSASISVDGASSYGIAVEADMIGDIVNYGRIDVTGRSSFGFMSTGHITGSIETDGTITAQNHQGSGVYIGGGLDGTYTHIGGIVVGLASQVLSRDGFTFTRLPAILGRNGIWIASDVTGGVLLQGNGSTMTQESQDAFLAASGALDSTITLISRGPGIFITPGGPSNAVNNITVGPRAGENGFSFVNRGNVVVNGTQGGVNASAFDIEGVISGETIYTATLQGGFWNDGGDIGVSALDGSATAMRVGNHGVVTSIRNDGDLSVFTVDSTSRTIDDFVGELGGDGYAVLVEASGGLNSFTNSGLININVKGPTSSAYGIVDRSGTLTNFENNGTIEAVNPEDSTGETVAVDLSANISGLSFANSGTITGEVLLGAGNQTVSLVGGTITGNLTFQAGSVRSGSSSLAVDGGTVTGRVSLGSGNHILTLLNGADLDGGVVQGTGRLDLSMSQSRMMVLDVSPLAVSTATVGAGSRLTFNISGGGQAAGAAMLDSIGQIVIDADARLNATVSGIIDATQTYTLVRAGSLSLGAPLSEIVTPFNSFMNNIDFSISPTDSNVILLSVERKTTEQLGLGPNSSAIYNSFTTALNSDTPVAKALSSLQTQEEFSAGIRQLLPDTSGATLQAALNNQDMGTGMIRRRLVAVAKSGLPNHAQGDVAGFWVQAIGGFASQDANGEQAGFSVWGLGIALGADMPVLDRAHIGFSLMESWQSASLRVSNTSPVEFYTTQLSAYGHHQNDHFYTQAILTAAYNTYETQRNVEFGGLQRSALGKWNGYQWGGSLETGAFFNWDLYQISPYIRGAYVSVHEDGYTETLGGGGINLVVSDKNADSIRGSVGFALDRDFPIFYDSYVEAEIRANYTRDILNDPVSVAGNFVTGDTPFTVSGNKRSPNRINLGVGIAHKDSYSSISVDYDTEIASGYMSHTATITARFRF